MTRSNHPKDSALGKPADYPTSYSKSALFAIPRTTARESNGIKEPLPFHGDDLWTAWDLTWLDSSGKPVVAVADIVVSANSANIIESKSMKLYLGSFAMSRFDSAETITDIISADLSECAGRPVAVDIVTMDRANVWAPGQLAGDCIDSLVPDSYSMSVDPRCLKIDKGNLSDTVVYSHLLRSLCPVTAQPDLGSIEIRYRGPTIDPASLLQYIISFREHNDFHEACIERMFVDIQERCETQALSVYARYQRRGGIDINPFRSDNAKSPRNDRLARQ